LLVSSLTAIQKNLGHERAATTDLYLQSLGDSVRQAMGLLEGVSNESTTDEKEAVKPSASQWIIILIDKYLW
jgi:hypothetical protein